MITINKKSWADVSISEYDRIMDVVCDKELSDAEKDVALIAILAGVPEDVVWDLDIMEVKRLRLQLSWLNLEFNYPKKINFKKIKIGEWECNVLQDIDKMTYAQFVDFQNYVRDIAHKKKEILSIFFIPTGKKYGEDYDIVGLQNAIGDNVSILTYNTVWFFFLKKYRASLNRTAIYLASMLRARAFLMRKKNPLKAKYKELAKIIREMPTMLG